MITSRKKQFFAKGKNVKKLVDTTGAGDAFAAGFLYGLLKDVPLDTCAKWGNMMGAKATTDFGLHWLEKIQEGILD